MKNLKSFFIFTFLVLAIFLISSCSSKPSTSASKDDVRTGTQGIVMNFLPNNPPDKVHADSSILTQFDVILELRNQGAYPQPEERGANSAGGPPGKIYLSGYDPYIITLTPKSGFSAEGTDLNKLALDGKSTINLNGGQDILAFQGTIPDYKKLTTDIYNINLLATACYQYQTSVGPTVCIDPDPFTTVNQKKVCTVSGVSLTSQGGPIAVTKIDEEAFDQKTQFKITIKNVGGGDVIKDIPTEGGGISSDSSLNKCDPYGGLGALGGQKAEKITQSDMNKVYVKSVKIADRPINCGPYSDDKEVGKVKSKDGGLLRLVNGEGFLVCEITKGSQGEYSSTNTAYTTPMVIHLSYGYRTFIQTALQVIREPSAIGQS